jgi:signal transduction histidine kinase
MGTQADTDGHELRHQPVASVMTRGVCCVAPEAPLLEVAAEMRRRRISCVVVCRDARPVGIVSERDLVRVLCEAHVPPQVLTAACVMSSPVRTVRPERLCPEVIEAMRTQGFRRYPVVDGEGRLLGLVTQTDLLRASERALAAHSASLEVAVARKSAELARISSLKDDLTGMMVHDMKNSLAVVLGVLDSAISGRQASSEPRLRKRLTLALEAAHSVLRMVLNLLDITKMEAGELKPERGLITVDELIERGLRPVSDLAERTGLRIEVIRERGDEKLFLDVGLAERVLQNLVSNAIKFSPPAERIEIDARIERQRPCSLLLSVSNQGPAIAAEHHAKIFDKFAQLEIKSSGSVASTGLGLTFCRLAVEAHGGRIEVESPLADDRGVRFTCVVPME